MAERTRTKWKNITRYDSGATLTRPTLRKIALDLGLKAAGATSCYGLGLFAGEIMEHTPYINQWIAQAVDYVSNINVEGSLAGLMGLLGGIYGFTNSGTETFDDDPSRLEKIELSPISIKPKKKVSSNPRPPIQP